MKSKLLNNINISIDVLKNISTNDKKSHWDLNTLLEKHYAMKNFLLEYEEVDIDKIGVLVVNLESEVESFINTSS